MLQYTFGNKKSFKIVDKSLKHLESMLVWLVFTRRQVAITGRPQGLWKCNKPHCATIKNRTLTHYNEFHLRVLNGNNEVCASEHFSVYLGVFIVTCLSVCAHNSACCAYGCLLLSLPGQKYRNVGCSPSACVWIQDCFLPPNSNEDRKRSADGTADRKKKRMTNDNVHQHYLHSISPAWVM